MNSPGCHTGELVLTRTGTRGRPGDGCSACGTCEFRRVLESLTFCYLIPVLLPPVPIVSTLAPGLVSPCTSPSLVTHMLTVCPRPPNCLNYPLKRLLHAGFASDQSSAAELFAASFGKAKARFWEAIKQEISARTKAKCFSLPLGRFLSASELARKYTDCTQGCGAEEVEEPGAE